MQVSMYKGKDLTLYNCINHGASINVNIAIWLCGLTLTEVGRAAI